MFLLTSAKHFLRVSAKASQEVAKKVLFQIIKVRQKLTLLRQIFFIVFLNSVSEGSRLISDILGITNIVNMEGYLLTLGTKKTFDSVDHYFLLAIRKK